MEYGCKYSCLLQLPYLFSYSVTVYNVSAVKALSPQHPYAQSFSQANQRQHDSKNQFQMQAADTQILCSQPPGFVRVQRQSLPHCVRCITRKSVGIENDSSYNNYLNMRSVNNFVRASLLLWGSCDYFNNTPFIKIVIVYFIRTTVLF